MSEKDLSMCSSISSDADASSVDDVFDDEVDIDDVDPDEMPLSAFSAPKCSTPVAKKARKDFVSSILSPFKCIPCVERLCLVRLSFLLVYCSWLVLFDRKVFDLHQCFLVKISNILQLRFSCFHKADFAKQ